MEGLTMQEPLTERQQQIYNFIKKTVTAKGYPPSVREIGDAIGLQSSSTVHSHITRLIEKGYIKRDPSKPRAIEIITDENTHMYEPVIQVPVLGKVTAGAPITAIENIDEYFPLPEHFTAGHNSEIFLLTVVGDSMIEAGIHDGDKVIVRKQNIAHNGDIIVAMTEEDEATVKTFYKEQGYYRLQPENSALEPIILEQVSVLGKVVGLFREM